MTATTDMAALVYPGPWWSEEAEAARIALYIGLFDDSVAVEPAPEGVRLLNPKFAGEDPASRRFAQIEIE